MLKKGFNLTQWVSRNIYYDFIEKILNINHSKEDLFW